MSATVKNKTIQSPCNLVCTIDLETMYCFGCGRTNGEIASWASMTEQARCNIMKQLPERLKKIERPKRRTTRRRKMADQKANQ